jgi:kynurenine formamidase
MDDWRAMAERVRNWGRWGADDELGTLNLITDEKVKQAASLVTKGRVFPLGMAFSDKGPQALFFRRNPLHLMTVDGGDARSLLEIGPWWDANPRAQEVSGFWKDDLLRFNDDFIVMHLQAATQWDALSHAYYEEQLYNGYPASTVTSFGASKNSIDKVDVKGVTSRAVLLDMVRHRGGSVDAMNGSAIMPDELTAAAEAQGVEIEQGDIVMVRTGFLTKFYADGDVGMLTGLHWSCAEWLWERNVAAVAADNAAVEYPLSDLEGNMLPMHLLSQRDSGLSFGEFWVLDDLADDCAADGRWECQVVAPPLRITGAVGSPVNPIAIK